MIHVARIEAAALHCSPGRLSSSLTDDASAKPTGMPRDPAPCRSKRKPRPRRSAAILSRERHAAADAGARTGAKAKGQFQGMRRLPRDGGGAEGLVHDGHAGRTSRIASRAKTRSIASVSQNRSRSAASPFRSTNGTPASPMAAAAASRATTRALAAAACRRRASISRPRNSISPGCRRRSAAPTGCRANPSANISPAPAPRRRSGSATPSPRRTPTTRHRPPMAAGRAARTARDRWWWIPMRQSVRTVSGARQRLRMDRGLLQQALQ